MSEQQHEQPRRRWGELTMKERRAIAVQRWGRTRDPWLIAVVNVMIERGCGYAVAMETVNQRERSEG